jgi:hypothetical protein
MAFNAPAGKAVFNAELGEFPAGIYWLELAGQGGTAQRKLLIR